MNSRRVDRIVTGLQSGPISRLIGTVDIERKGVDHTLEQVDPFILLDEASIPVSNAPPFGPHPHRSHCVLTALLQGRERSWDSISNRDTVVQAPASYWLEAGSGVFHDEASVIPDENDSSQHVKLFQLWVGVREVHRSKPARLQYSTNLPKVDAIDNSGNVIGSKLYFLGDNVPIDTPLPLRVMYVEQNAKTTLRLSIPAGWNCFLVNESGNPLTVVDDSTSSRFNDVLVLDQNGSHVDVRTDDKQQGKYFVAMGEPTGERWYKKLVASGAVIAQTAEEAREIAVAVKQYAEQGKRTGNFAPDGCAKV